MRKNHYGDIPGAEVASQVGSGRVRNVDSTLQKHHTELRKGVAGAGAPDPTPYFSKGVGASEPYAL